MIWIPVLSILFFIAVFGWSVYIGIKNGWKAALFISLLILAFTGLFIGIAAAIYNPILWPAYKTHILNSKIENGISIDLEAFKDTYRAVILLEFAGLSFPITVLMVWAIYHFVKRPLNKYLGHETRKTKKVNKYKKTIVLRRDRSRLYSRIGGGVILGTTGLMTAAFAASAVNTVTTPYKHANGTTRFFDALAVVDTFGQGNNDEAAQVITGFLKSVDHKLVNNVSNLVSFETDSSKTTLPDIVGIKELISNKVVFQELFKNAEASQKMFQSMFGKHGKIEAILFDERTASGDMNDLNGNQVSYGYNANDLLFEKDIDNYFDDNKKLIDQMNFPELVRWAIYHNISGRMQGLENSPFSNNVDSAEELKADYEKKKNERIAEKKSKISSASNAAETLLKSIRNYENLISDGEHQQVSGYDIDSKNIREEFNNLTVNEPMNIDTITTGVIGKLKKQIDELTIEIDKLNININDAQNVYDNHNNNFWIPAEAEKESAQDDVDKAQSDTTTAQNEVNDINNYIASLNEVGISLSNEINGFRNELSADKKTVDSNKRTIESLQKQIDQKNKELINRKDNALTAYHQAMAKRKNAEAAATAVGITQSKDVTKAKAAEDLAKKANDDLQSPSYPLQLDINKLAEEMNRLISSNTGLTDRIKELEGVNGSGGLIADKQKQIDDNKRTKADKNAELISKKSVLSDYKKVLNANNAILAEKTRLFNSEDKKKSANLKRLNDFKNKKDKADSVKSTDESNKANYIAEFNDRKFVLDEKKNELTEIEHSYDVLINTSGDFDTSETQPYDEFSTNPSNQDDLSIMYCEKEIEFIDSKITQLKKIKEDKNNLYEDKAKHFRTQLKKWLSLE